MSSPAESAPRRAAGVSAPRTTAGALARIGIGLCLLGCAAAIIATTGVGGLGGLGSLFGFGHHKSSPAAQVSGPGAALSHVASTGFQAFQPVAHVRAPARKRDHARRRAGARPSPGRPPASSPPTSPPTQSPAAPAPPRPPTPSAGVVGKTVETVQQTGKALPPQAHPVTDPVVQQVVSTVNSACGTLGGCP